MLIDEKRGSAQERVLSQLREMIVTLELKPGAAIDKAALCEKFGVSRFPVSEALARLQTEGLVEILPQRGTLVSRIYMGEVEQAMFIRRALEIEMVQSLAPVLSEETLSQMELNLDFQEIAIKNGAPAAFHELDLAFHAIMLDALDFDRVKRTTEAARRSLERARRLLSSSHRHTETLKEHRAIVSALTARDGAAAASAMRAHLDVVLNELAEFSAENPDIISKK